MFFDRYRGRDGASSVAGSDVERKRRSAQRELLAVGRFHIAFGIHGILVWIARRQIPVGGTQNDMRMIIILQVLRAARVVAVAAL